MYEMTMKSKMLDVLSPDSTSPQAHKDLAANVLKFLSEWTEKGHAEMGDYLGGFIWTGVSSLREVDGHIERVNDSNPQAPEYNTNIFTQPGCSATTVVLRAHSQRELGVGLGFSGLPVTIVTTTVVTPPIVTA